MVKKFTIPFASQGDANDIPDALQVDGKVSFTQGFGYDYERPYDDPQAKDIAREDMNGLFKAITSAVGELQTLGASEWSSAISYPKGAIVYFEKDLYISQVDDNQSKPPQNWVSITSIANDSLKKAANLSDLTNKATARNNLGLGSSATLNKTDVLGTSSNLVATQKLVNDTRTNINNDINSKIDKTSITNELGDSTELVASQALVSKSQRYKVFDRANERAAEVEYTNTTEYLRFVRVSWRPVNMSNAVRFFVDEVLTTAKAGGDDGTPVCYVTAEVPPGSSYKLNPDFVKDGTLLYWVETEIY